MSISRKIFMCLWPRNTMKAAYWQWQAQEKRLLEVRQRLARQYLVLRQQAEQVHIKTHLGVLRAARLLLDQPLDPGISMVKNRVQKRLAWRGQGCFRRVPSPLAVELAHYAAGIEKLCRSHDELGARLRLAQQVMEIFGRNPEFCSPHCFRLALNSPESAWLIFLLHKQRLKDHRAIQPG
jgi:hypothetical protein